MSNFARIWAELSYRMSFSQNYELFCVKAYRLQEGREKILNKSSEAHFFLLALKIPARKALEFEKFNGLSLDFFPSYCFFLIAAK